MHSLNLKTTIVQQIAQLNSIDNFSIEFKAQNIVSAFLEEAIKKGNGSFCKQFLILVQHCGDKSVFVDLKWLVTLHQIIQSNLPIGIYENILTTLSRIDRPKIKTRHEQYIFNKLIKPYCQYLQKICQIQDGCLSTQNKQNMAPQGLYMEYNLIIFACQQFANPIKEFTGFFCEYYPTLNKYVHLIRADLKRYNLSVRQNSSKKQLQNVSFFEIQDLKQKIDIFSINQMLKHNSKQKGLRQITLQNNQSHQMEVINLTEFSLN